MAQTIVLQQISIPAQPEESAPASGSQAISEDASAQPLPGQMSSRQDDETSCNSSERRTEQANNAANTVPLNQGRLWSETLSRIANTCAMLALLLTIVFGATQWVAQDKSITIAKESELVSLALSCTDKEIKNTSVCQQFLEKYPGGPEISRREDIHIDTLAPEDGVEAELVRLTLGHTAAHLAMMDQFLRNQSTRFQSALKTSDLQLPLLQIEDIINAEKAFLQDMALLKAKLARQQAHGAGLTPRDGDRRGPQNTHAVGSIFLSRTIIIATSLAILAISVALLLRTEFGLILALGLIIGIADTIECWRWPRIASLYSISSNFLLWTIIAAAFFTI